MIGRALVAPGLRGYEPSWLVPDLIAGVTLMAIAVPEQMASARLANMPVVTGLYAFIAGSLVFALVGAHRHMSVGADSTIAPVFAAGIATVAVAGSSRYTDLVTVMALVVGIVLILVGLGRLGWIADFLPAPVVSAVLTGIAIQIAVRQLPAVLGLPGGGTTTIGRLEAVYDQRADVNGWSVAIAVMVLAIIVVSERVDRRIPGALIGLVASTGAVAAFDLRAHGVLVIGSFHATAPSFGVPSFRLSDLRRLAGTIATVVFLCVVQTAATARSSAAEHETASGFNRDLAGLGIANLAAGLSGSFSLNASPPRTTVVETAGGRSQATSLVAAVGVLVVVLVSGVLTDVPEATLGAILLYVAGRLLRVGELRRVLAFDRVEFAVSAITVVVVAFVGIEQGVALAVVLALAERIRLSARPRGVLLGREPGTDHWIPVDLGRPTEQVEGVVVFLPYAPLWYANAEYLMNRLRALVEEPASPVHALVLDADAISDIDYTAARLLRDLVRELAERGVRIGIARTSHIVHHDLKHSGLIDTIGPEQLFDTVQAAVSHLASR